MVPGLSSLSRLAVVGGNKSGFWKKILNALRKEQWPWFIYISPWGMEILHRRQVIEKSHIWVLHLNIILVRIIYSCRYVDYVFLHHSKLSSCSKLTSPPMVQTSPVIVPISTIAVRRWTTTFVRSHIYAKAPYSANAKF